MISKNYLSDCYCNHVKDAFRKATYLSNITEKFNCSIEACGLSKFKEVLNSRFGVIRKILKIGNFTFNLTDFLK